MIHRSQFDRSKRKVRSSKMARKLQLLAIIFAMSISVGYAKDPKKIIMGEAASIAEFPHQVSLQTENGFHFCGGTIIASIFILTAAHCIVDENRNPRKGDIYAVIGTNDKERHTPYNVFRVVRRIHHNYKPADSSRNDIAILKLNRPIEFNDLLKPAELPLRDVPAGTHVISTGWGATTYDPLTKEGGNAPRFLQKLERTVLSQEECQKNLKNSNRIGPEHICVWSPDGADSCSGDSGGPLTYNGEVIGVTSFGIGCGLNYPDVYTRVHHYLNWIQAVTRYMAYNLPLPSYSADFVEA